MGQILTEIREMYEIFILFLILNSGSFGFELKFDLKVFWTKFET